MSTKIQFVEPAPLGQYLLSPDGRFTLVIGPDEPVRLYQNEGTLALKQTLPEHVFADAAAFNRESSECALIIAGTALIKVDLNRKTINPQYPVNGASTLCYGANGVVFVGTTTGEVHMFVPDEYGDLTEQSSLKVSDYGVVLMTASPLFEGVVALYTDDGELYSANFIENTVLMIDRGEQTWMIEGMAYHPDQHVFVLWRRNGDISLSSPQGWLLLSFYPYNEEPQHMLQSVIALSERRLLVVTGSEVVELNIVFPQDLDNVQFELDASFDYPDGLTIDENAGDDFDFDRADEEFQSYPLLGDRIIYQVQSNYRILAVTADISVGFDEPDLTVLTTF